MSEHDKPFAITDSHERIWLEPQCNEGNDEGRLWCWDNVWGECCDCQSPAVEYVRADLFAELAARVALLEAKQ